MPDPFIGEIRAFAFDYAPVGWALCDGQLMEITQNPSLFSLLGNRYGGNGTTNFAVPDLRGRAAIGYGNGPNLAPYNIAQWGGEEIVTLELSQIPSHTHQLYADAEPGSAIDPEDQYPAEISFAGAKIYSPDKNVAMNPGAIGDAGGSQPHENRSPYLAINFCIATEGQYPPRH